MFQSSSRIRLDSWVKSAILNTYEYVYNGFVRLVKTGEILVRKRVSWLSWLPSIVIEKYSHACLRKGENLCSLRGDVVCRELVQSASSGSLVLLEDRDIGMVTGDTN